MGLVATVTEVPDSHAKTMLRSVLVAMFDSVDFVNFVNTLILSPTSI